MTERIADGETRLLAIVGDPVRQARAPRLWSALFRANGVNALCLPFHVAPADLAAFVAGMRTVRNLAGLIVTVPHKPAAALLADRLTPRARRVGAVNLLRADPEGGWTGDIQDGEGFTQGLLRAGQVLKGRRALLLGAGGVGTAIAISLVDAGVAAVHVADADPARAAELAQRLRTEGVDSAVAARDAEGFDLLVNATPLGLKPQDPLPFSPAQLRPGVIVGDVVMGAETSPLVALARQKGCFAQPGTVTMDEQLLGMAEFFRLPPGDYGADAIARVGC